MVMQQKVRILWLKLPSKYIKNIRFFLFLFFFIFYIFDKYFHSILNETTNYDKCSGLLEEAIDIYETEDKYSFCGDAYKSLIAVKIRAEKFQEAIEVIEKLSLIRKKLDQKLDIYKCCLSCVIVAIHLNDLSQAENIFTKYTQ